MRLTYSLPVDGVRAFYVSPPPSVHRIIPHEPAALRNVGHHVAVVVVAGEVILAVHGDREKPAHAARALFRAGKVAAPEALDGLGGTAGVVDAFKQEKPAVPDDGLVATRVSDAPVMDVPGHEKMINPRATNRNRKCSPLVTGGAKTMRFSFFDMINMICAVRGVAEKFGDKSRAVRGSRHRFCALPCRCTHAQPQNFLPLPDSRSKRYDDRNEGECFL